MFVYKFEKKIEYCVFEALVAAHSALEAKALVFTEHKADCSTHGAGDLETMEMELQTYTVSLGSARILSYVCVDY